MPLQIAVECLNGCSGCEVAILNMGEALVELLPELDFVHLPLLMDHKYGEGRGGDGPAIPEAGLGIVSGGLRTREHVALATHMRERCKAIVAMGTCAGHGGIPALANQYSNGELFEGADSAFPDGGMVMLDRIYALDEKIEVDFHLPGCPPHPDYIEMTFRAFLDGRRPVLPLKSVCDACPVRREGKGMVKGLGRLTRNAQYEPGTSLAQMRCFLEQGLLCMGPVTRGGCGGMNETVPKCIAARMPCRGCYGPIRHNGNPSMDMLNALTSNGIDVRDVPDRQGTFLRFSGAHGLLRRRVQKPGVAGRKV